MKTKIWEVCDRSGKRDCSLVLYKFEAAQSYKFDKHARSREYEICDRLWVDFKNGRFMFADQTDKANWGDCSIAGNPYTQAVTIFPCDDDTFMCAISLQGLTPRKFKKGMSYTFGGPVQQNWCYPSNATLNFIGYNGGYLDNKNAFLTILEYQNLQGYHEHPTAKCQKFPEMYDAILTGMAQEWEAEMSNIDERRTNIEEIVKLRTEYKDFQETLLKDCGLVVKDFDGKVISNKWDEFVK